MKKKSYIYSVLFICGLALYSSCKDEDNTIQVDFESSQNNITAGEKIVFNDLSKGKVSAWNWSFEGGVPATSQLSQPEVSYNRAGEYSVTLEVRNIDGSVSVTKEKFVVVGHSKVVADFTSNTVNTMNDTPVAFTDQSTGSPSNWQWTFTPQIGTPFTSTEQHPEITFTQPGIYTVKLEASNADFSDTKIVEDYLTVIDAQNVIADFTSDEQLTYEGGIIAFTDKSIGRITSWLWTFEGADITSSSVQNPLVKFTTAGSHKVTLTASNGQVSNTVVKEYYINVISSNGLSVFFKFNGELKDELSSVITSKVVTKGTIAFDIADRKGVTGNAANYDGTGGFIVQDDDAFNLGTGNYTIAVWLKVAPEYSTTKMVPWQESGANGSGDNQTWLRLYSTATNQLTFATEDAAGGSTIHLTEGNSAVYNIANGVWRHVLCVRDGLKTSIYIDGTLARSVNSTKGIKDVSNAGDFKVGCQETKPGEYSNKYVGAMDDLIIYKRALSAKEISDLYKY